MMQQFIGIDIAAKSFDLVSRAGGRNRRAEQFEQSPKGHRQAIARLKTLKPAIIVMEATGVYYLDLAVALHAAGLPVAVINPKSFRHFAKLKLQGNKTDPVDAALLAEFGERMTPALWAPPEASLLALRDIGRQINRLGHARTQAKNRLHALKAKRMTPAFLIKDEQTGIAQLDRRIEKLTQAAKAYIAENESLSGAFDNITAAVGVAQTSGITILAELSTLPVHLKANQVTRHAGLNVILEQSGTSLNRPGRLSKTGNPYLRGALFMPAMSAVQHDPYAKAFYEHLINNGKKRLQAICAVKRKYLTGLWACMQNQTPFDSSKLFSEIHFRT